MDNNKARLHSALLAAYKKAFPSKNHSVCDAEVSAIWKKIKSSSDCESAAASEISKWKIKAQTHKSTLFHFLSKNPPKAPDAANSQEKLSIVIAPPGPTKRTEAKTNENENNAPATTTSKSPVQDELKNEICNLSIEIEAMNKKITLGIATEIEKQTTVRKKELLEKKQVQLKLKQQDQIRQQRKRQQQKRTLEELCLENPEIKKKLKMRETVGRPRIETDQPGLLDAIKDIALYGSAADDRRRSDVIRTIHTKKELTLELQKRYDIKESAVYLRLLPKNSLTKEGKRHVSTVPVKLAKARNDYYQQHVDSKFCTTTINYLEEIASLLGPSQVLMISQDDKARVPLGKTAANKQSPILMHVEYRVKLPDHDWVVAEKHKLIPSVYALIKIKPDGLGSRDAVTFSGPTYIGIQSGKHSQSTAISHHRDLNRILELDCFTSFTKNALGETKPIIIIIVDGGPDENPRYQKVIQMAARHFIDNNLDAIFIATNAPGRSAFNRVERRMAPLSKDLSGLILKHDFFGSHLNSKGETIDKELEVKNFSYAGKTLAEIWSATVIDGFETVAEYIEPNLVTSLASDSSSSVITNIHWRDEHIRESHYFLQIVKCKNLKCCSSPRSSYFDFFTKFVPGPRPLKQESNTCSFPDTTRCTLYMPLFENLAVKNQTEITNMAFDWFCPSIRSIIASRTCQMCRIYYASISSLKNHSKVCKQNTKEIRKPLKNIEKRIRVERTAAKRQKELMVVWKTFLTESSDAVEHCDWEHEDNVEGNLDLEEETEKRELIIDISDHFSSPWEEDK